ncbi:MAG: hypothetical protein GX879_08375 [Bacteroidales bacterium]|nr:hypothetical protein [Bacteroidales bacterium]
MKQIPFLAVLILSLIFITSCKKDKYLPVLITNDVTEITASTAFCGGNITSDGGSIVIARGVCWSTSENPTILDSKTSDGEGAGSFESKIKNLEPGITYYVRAYATNKKGTGYGSTMVFKTMGGSINPVGSFTDSRDGTVYKTVEIGNQVWMAENLKYLPQVDNSHSLSNPKYYVLNYSGTDKEAAKVTDSYKTMGVLYNWLAAMADATSSNANPSGVQGVCPAGWHLPSDAEWTELENFLANNGYNYDGTTGGGRDKIAKAMASAIGWDSSDSEGVVGNTDYPEYQNKSGFLAISCGSILGHPIYDDIAFSIEGPSLWWSATEYDTDSTAWCRYITYFNRGVVRANSFKASGYSVRCVKD